MEILRIESKKIYDWLRFRHYAHRIPSISYCFGLFENEMSLTPAVFKKPPELDEVYLICSDGLTDMVSDEIISNIIRYGGSIAKIVDNMVTAALAAGGGDNVTVALVKITEAEDDRPLVKRLFSGKKTRLNPNTKHRSIFDFR